MRHCIHCGSEISDTAVFCISCGKKQGENVESQSVCPKCGTELIDGVCPKCTSEQQVSNQTDERFRRFFMHPKEKLVTTLGNTYIQNYLKDGSVKNGFSVVSDKRVYFQGTTYEMVTKNNGKKKVIKTRKSRTVDLQDVTGTGFDSHSNVLALVIAILLWIAGLILWIAMLVSILSEPSYMQYEALDRVNHVGLGDIGLFVVLLLLCSVPGMIAFTVYLYSRMNLIAIQFAGGEIAFNISWFPEKEIADFQKLLRLAKDKAIEEADNAVANKLQEAVSSATVDRQSVSSSVADELIKYGELLEKGLITQEEFEKKKQELL